MRVAKPTTMRVGRVRSPSELGAGGAFALFVTLFSLAAAGCNDEAPQSIEEMTCMSDAECAAGCTTLCEGDPVLAAECDTPRGICFCDCNEMGTGGTGGSAVGELFVSFGTGNEVFEPNSAQYRKEYVVQVSDLQGNGVSGVTVQVGVVSTSYFKGFYLRDIGLGSWVLNYTAGPCPDEDVDRDGVIDPGEDSNGNGSIEAGNIASVVPQGGTGGTITTDASGFGAFDVFYPQQFANWVTVELTATASTQDSEFATSSEFRLFVNQGDIDDLEDPPPGNPSPFGSGTSCEDTL